MKTFLKVLLVILILGEGVIIFFQKNENNTLEEQNISLEMKVRNMELNLYETIASDSTWYVVTENLISSEPRGKGILLGLDVPLESLGNGANTSYPHKNKRVFFYPKVSGYKVVAHAFNYHY